MISLWTFQLAIIFLVRECDCFTPTSGFFECTGKLRHLTGSSPSTSSFAPSEIGSSPERGGPPSTVSNTPLAPSPRSSTVVEPSAVRDIECSSSYSTTFNNSCYKFIHQNSANRSTAKSKCESEFAHLVYIEDGNENNFIVDQLDHEAYYWIGLQSVPRRLYWDNGNELTFNRSDPDNSNTFNNGGGCYRLGSKKNLWLDTPCNNENLFICEYEGIEGTGCPSGYTMSFQDSCYKITKDSYLNRSAAKMECKSNSAHLLFIENQQEDEFFEEALRTNDNYWIGLWSEPLRLFWGYGKEAIFDRFNRELVDTFNDGSGCYYIGSDEQRLWVDSPCHMSYGYICEYELSM